MKSKKQFLCADIIKEIISYLNPQDKLIVCDINKEFQSLAYSDIKKKYKDKVVDFFCGTIVDSNKQIPNISIGRLINKLSNLVKWKEVHLWYLSYYYDNYTYDSFSVNSNCIVLSDIEKFKSLDKNAFQKILLEALPKIHLNKSKASFFSHINPNEEIPFECRKCKKKFTIKDAGLCLECKQISHNNCLSKINTGIKSKPLVTKNARVVYRKELVKCKLCGRKILS
jgi:hypothetical protein